MSHPLISVIVPCYNVEAFVFKALDSVFTQTYTNWECILIDDGSTDNTKNVTKEWVEKDTRFKYHYQENQGLSGARNSGLKLASGEFVFFFDSDDLLDTYSLSDLFSLMETDIDIVFGKNAITEGQNKNIVDYMKHNPQSLIKHTNQSKSLLKLVIEEPLICVAWNRLYRKSFLDQNNLTFKKGILHEDELWFFQTLFHANAIVLNEKPTYYYNVANVNSITNNFNAKNLESYLSIIKYINSEYYINVGFKAHQEIISIYLTHLKIITIGHCFKKLTKRVRKNSASLIEKVFNEIQPTRTKKVLLDSIEVLHFNFKFVECLSPKEILAFLKYYNSPKTLRKMKKVLLLKKANIVNTKTRRTINKVY